MMFIKLTFWLLIAGVCYTYLLYGVILLLFSSKRSVKVTTYTDEELPDVLHIIAAFNEEAIITQKIQNTIALDYPSHKIKTIIVADGSTDDTVSIIKQFPSITLLYDPKRAGKLAAINKAVRSADASQILVFSDANTMLNKEAIRNMMKHYADPNVGGVAAEKKVNWQKQGFVRGEGLYWLYESTLKKLEDRFYTVVGAAGELFSMRRDLFEPLAEDIILDDLMLSLQICKKGYVVRYEPGSYALEEPSLTIQDEQKRKTRISAGAFQIIGLTTDLLNPITYGKLAFQYWSHRILRWAFCPFAIPLIFLINAWLVFQEQGVGYDVLFIFQTLFFILALIGNFFTRFNKQVSNLFYIPFYIVFMQIAQWKGFWAKLRGTQSVQWDKAPRQYTHLGS